MNDERHYVPILKGRLGELRALQEVDDRTASRLTPILELVPGSVEYDDDGEATSTSVKSEISAFVARLVTRWRPDRRLIADAHMVPSASGVVPVADLITEFGKRGRTVTPTVRPSDGDDTIRAVSEAMHEWGVRDACVRLAGEDLDDTDAPLPDAIDRVLDLLDCEPSRVDLILDFGSVPDERSLVFAARIARLVLAELPYEEQWRTLAVAAGAFPTDLSEIQPDVLSEVPRHDAAMWRAIRERVRGRVPSFGDYAVAHPIPATGPGSPRHLNCAIRPGTIGWS